MNNNSEFNKYKHETIELAKKKNLFLTLGLILLGVALALFIIGGVVLAAANDGQFHHQAAYILLALASNSLIACIVLLILRKAIFDKRLKEREALINKIIKERKAKKVSHEQ